MKLDDEGNLMTPSYAVKSGVHYRYYVSRAITEGRKNEAGSIARVAENRSKRSIAMMISLAFLAPDIVEAAVDGRLPRGVASDAWSIYHPTGLSNAGCSGCRRLAKQFNFSSDGARTTLMSHSRRAQIPAAPVFVEATHRSSLRAALRSPNSVRVSL